MKLVHYYFTISIIAGASTAINLTEFSQHLELYQAANTKPEVLWQAIFPGTKWCGDGDIAKDYDDLGTLVETDKCCRDHDHCKYFIVAHSTNHGLTNDGKYTKLHCDCDSEFYGCLKTSNMFASNLVGNLYFNVLGNQCFNYTPKAYCITYLNIERKSRCIQYLYEDGEMFWQWFDIAKY